MSADVQVPAEYRPAGTVDLSSALDEYRGPWNSRLAAHLLRRAGFGGSPQDIANATGAGMDATVSQLDPLRTRSAACSTSRVTSRYPMGATADKTQRRNAYILTEMWWLDRCLRTQDPLRERMTYFWSNHFTSAIGEKGITPQMMVDQFALFRRFALGNYADLTHAVTTDPAMLHYLDGIVNRAQHPNENYARELMELFTMGVGNYTEEDVRQGARAFTGLTVYRFGGQAVFNPQLPRRW